MPIIPLEEDPDGMASLVRRLSNRMLHVLARTLPGATTVRPFLHRLRGVKIEGWTFIADDVYLENEYPECIEIGEGAMIGLRSTVMSHFGGGLGKVIIGRNATLTAHSVVLAHDGQILEIGEGSLVAARSLVLKSVPPFTMVAGNPAKPIARVTIPFPLVRDEPYEVFKKGLRPLEDGGGAGDDPGGDAPA